MEVLCVGSGKHHYQLCRWLRNTAVMMNYAYVNRDEAILHER